MSKNKLRFTVALAAVLAAFSVIAFVVPFVKNGCFWLSYIFAVLAIAVQFYAMPKAMGGEARSKFYGFPILRVSFAYLVIQVLLSFVFMALAKWVPVWIPVVLYVLLLCAALIGFVAADSVREEVERQDVLIKKQVSTMRMLQSRLSTLAAQCDSEAAAAAVSRLAEELRFSDPVSCEALIDAESELSACIDTLQQAVVDGSEEDILTLCRRTSAALAERNRLCKLNK